MNKFKRKLLDLSFVLNALCLSFNASASNLDDLPNNVTKIILSKCDMFERSELLNIPQVSKKFYILYQDIYQRVEGETSPGIAVWYKLKDTIESLFNGNLISVYPSTNPDFNQCFDFTKSSETKRYFKNIFSIYLTNQLLYPNNKEAIIGYSKNNDDSAIIYHVDPKMENVQDGKFLVSSPSAFLTHYDSKNLDDLQDLSMSKGEISVFTLTGWESDYGPAFGLVCSCIYEYKRVWPFEIIKNITYKEYFPAPLENNNDQLIKLVNAHYLKHKRKSDSNIESMRSRLGPQYASSVLPKLTHFVDYIVYGRLNNNKDLTVTYRFSQPKQHSKELINGLNDGSLPRR